MSLPKQDDMSIIDREEKKPKTKEKKVTMQKPAKPVTNETLPIKDTEPEETRLEFDDYTNTILIHAHAANYFNIPEFDGKVSEYYNLQKMRAFNLGICFGSGELKTECEKKGGHMIKEDQSHTYFMLDNPKMTFDKVGQIRPIELYNPWINPIQRNKRDMEKYHGIRNYFDAYAKCHLIDNFGAERERIKFYKQDIGFAIKEKDTICEYDKYAYQESVGGVKKAYDIYVRTKKASADMGNPLDIEEEVYGVGVMLYTGKGEYPVDVQVTIRVPGNTQYMEMKKLVKSKILYIELELEIAEEPEIEGELKKKSTGGGLSNLLRPVGGSRVIPSVPVRPIGVTGVQPIMRPVQPVSIKRPSYLAPLQPVPQRNPTVPIQQEAIITVNEQKRNAGIEPVNYMPGSDKEEKTEVVMEIEKVEEKEKQIPVTTEQQEVVRMEEEPPKNTGSSLVDFMANLKL